MADAKITRLRTPIVSTFRATPPMNLLPLFRAQLPEFGGVVHMDPDSVIAVTVVRNSYEEAARAIGGVRGLARTLGWTLIKEHALYMAFPDFNSSRALVDVWLSNEAKRANTSTATPPVR